MQAKTIVLTGPESTGKTTLAQQLATHFNSEWLPEFARSYINDLDRPYIKNDLLEIAKGQLEEEKKIVEKNSGIVFFDTSLEVIKIWSEYKYGHCHPWILKETIKMRHDLYLLCEPDIKWHSDPQRENPKDRMELFNRYRLELKKLNLNFVIINGLKTKRLLNAIRHVESNIHIS